LLEVRLSAPPTAADIDNWIKVGIDNSMCQDGGITGIDEDQEAVVSTPATGARRATIYDIARAAGVSHMTVSRYLRFGPERVKEETRGPIEAAIAELDYRPNLVARAMRTRRTGRLALVLPGGTAASSLDLLVGARAAAHAAGYAIELVTLEGTEAERSAAVLDLSDSGLFEGIVSLTPIAEPTLTHANAPIVVCAYFDDESRGINELSRAEPIERIIEKLADDGHRRFLHLAGDYAHASARCRRKAYLDAVERLGLESYGVVDCNWRVDVAREAVLELPAPDTVTAVIAANDVLAAAALGAALRRGWSVPGDLSVTGWDNNPVGAAFTPALTTVEIDHVGLGRRAAQTLLNLLKGTTAPPAAKDVAQVIWRESTGPVAGSGSPGRTI
jgi:DNA-binding LacI/PurR family transcriptional regulator